jgi:ribokinase
MKRITVIGGYLVGLFLKGEAIPGIGQTFKADEYFEGGGGKGSNQAVAAAKLGANASFLGKIGTDKYGQDALKMYERFGMSRDSVVIDESTYTGVSVIFIDKDANNSIMCALGANLNLSKEDIDKAEPLLKESEIVGFVPEIPIDTMNYGIRKAHQLGAKVLLDPSYISELDEDLYKCIYIMKPNEHEATLLTGIKVTDKESGLAAGRWFIEKGVKHAVITLGEKGAVHVTENVEEFFETPKVDAVDTTGAGDCFSGALMTALYQGKDMKDAIIFANHAASLSVTRNGVIDALPTYDEVVKFINRK